MDSLQYAAEEISKATGLIFCLEDSFMKKFSSRLREKNFEVIFREGCMKSTENVIIFIQRRSSYRAINTLQLDYLKELVNAL